MANLENLKPFENGHEKVGGREKGVPNKLMPEKILNNMVELLQTEQTFYDKKGIGQTKTWLEWVNLGMLKQAAKGNAKAAALIYKLFKLLVDKFEIKSDVDSDYKNAAQLSAQLDELIDGIAKRESPKPNESA